MLTKIYISTLKLSVKILSMGSDVLLSSLDEIQNTAFLGSGQDLNVTMAVDQVYLFKF
jgi:hypothetical protein